MKAPSPLRAAFKRPRLLIPAALVVAVWLALRPVLARSTGFVAALDAGGILFLILIGEMVTRATAETTRRRAQQLDEGQFGMLAVTLLAGLLGLAAVFLETRDAKSLPHDVLLFHLALAGSSIVIAWLVTHTLFGLHYAHLYYGDSDGGKKGGHRGGLAFPGDEAPDYWDFLYFAFVVGMTCQTSDVGITRRQLRRLTLLHGVVAFFFNTVILAMSINIAASLLQP